MDKIITSDLERNNKTVMIAHIIDVTVVTILCILQSFSGSLDRLYALIAAVLGFIPVAVELIFWRKNHYILVIYLKNIRAFPHISNTVITITVFISKMFGVFTFKK